VQLRKDNQSHWSRVKMEHKPSLRSSPLDPSRPWLKSQSYWRLKTEDCHNPPMLGSFYLSFKVSNMIHLSPLDQICRASTLFSSEPFLLHKIVPQHVHTKVQQINKVVCHLFRRFASGCHSRKQVNWYDPWETLNYPGADLESECATC